jgi:hypothetical protein
MMRSAPAASAHLAEIPVPAPAPTMGVPAALLSRHRFRHADRSIVLLLPFPSLDPKATIRLLIPHSKRKSWTRRDRTILKEENRPNCACGCTRSTHSGTARLAPVRIGSVETLQLPGSRNNYAIFPLLQVLSGITPRKSAFVRRFVRACSSVDGNRPTRVSSYDWPEAAGSVMSGRPPEMPE